MNGHGTEFGSRLRKQDFFEDPTLPLQVYIRDPQPEFPLHSHAFDELVVILKGTARHVVDGQDFPVKAGDVFVVSQNREHQYLDMNGLALANILFDPEALQMDRWDIRALPGFHALFSLEPAFRSQHKFRSRLQLSSPELNTIHELIHSLTLEAERRAPGYRVMAKGLFMQLTVSLSRAYSSEPTEESLDLLRIGDAIAHIETHYAKRMRLDELAAKSHLSQRHFSRVFQKCIGRSAIEHLLHVRCQKAAELLKRTDRTITEIAFDCGFSDSNYFTRCFHKMTGQTPKRCRSAFASEPRFD